MPTPINDLPALERQIHDLEGTRSLLAQAILQCEQAKADVEDQFIGDIRRLTRTLGERQAAALAAVEANPGWFEKPKSLLLHGWKFGWAKQRGKLIVPDEAGAIAKLRERLKAAVADRYIQTKETLKLKEVRMLPGDTLAKIGVELQADTDAAFCEPVVGDITALAEALLKRAEAREQSRSQKN